MSISARLLVLGFFVSSPAIAGQPSPFVPLPWTPHGTTSQARFGAVVAPAGDVNGDGYRDVLVSAPKEEGPAADAGKVYLYLGSATGLASSPAWSWSANQAGGATGTSAAAAGDVNGDGYSDVVIGTPQWNAPGPVASAGKISVFHGSASGLPASPTYERLAPTPTVGAKFGFSVGTAGNVNGDAYDDVIVGAPFHTSGGLTGRGAAYVFHGSATGLAVSPALTVLGPEAGANFGKAVSTAGDVDADGYADVLVGAPGASMFGSTGGTVSFFRGSGTGLPAVADTVIGGQHDREETGAAVANAGDVNGDGYADVLIGHPGFGNGTYNQGGYELYLGEADGLAQLPALSFYSQNDGERLGASVATLGDINADGYADFAIGAPADSTPFPAPHVEVYFGGPTLGFPTQFFSGASGAAFFGFSIATAGDADGDGFSEFVVGDPGASVVPTAAEGTAALYELQRSVPDLMPNWPSYANDPGTQRGAAVAIAPGLDVSGYPSLVTSEPLNDPGFTDGGIIFIHRGEPGGIPNFITTTKFGESAGDRFGAVLADAGDIDRDGYSDIVVSSPTRTGPGGVESGRVALIRGSQNDGALDPVTILEGNQAQEHLGSALAGRGDVDGDGYHDVLIGAPQWDGPGLPECGKVWLFYGGPGGFRAGPWTAQGTIAGQGLGAGVSIGDLDGDGFDDVLVSSVSPLAVSPPAGKVGVYYGGIGGASASPAWEITGAEPSPTFGTAVMAAGDVNGDGVCDLIVGAPGEDGTGRAYVYKSDGSRSKLSIWATRVGTQAGARFGAAIGARGDVDGDGLGDFVIGEPLYDGVVGADAGRVHLFYGNKSAPIAAWKREGDASLMQLGAAVSSLGDLNHDGFADFVVGSPRPQGAAGATYVFIGNGVTGVDRQMALEKDLSSNPFLYYPIRIASGATAAAGFSVRSAEGRAKLGVQIEAIPTNLPFSGTPTQSAGPIDTGVPGAYGSVGGVFAQFQLPWMGVTYKIRMRSRTNSPFFPSSRWERAEGRSEGDYDVYRGGVEVGVRDAGSALAPRLASIAPNPLARSGHGTRIAYDLPRATAVSLDVFDVRGAHVRRLVNEVRPAGSSIVTWDGRDESGRRSPPGLYFVRMTAESVIDRARLVVLP
jgi:hypothetical protein